MNFKEFLKKKGISEADFAAKSAEEIAQLQSEYNGEVQKATDEKIENIKTSAVTEAKEAAEKAAKEAVERAAKDFPESITKEQFEDFKTKTDAMIENIGKTSGNKEENISAIAKSFDEQYKERIEKGTNEKGLMEGKLAIKAWTSTDTMTVSDVPAGTYPAAGTTGILSGVLGFFARLIPTFYRKPKPVSKIYNYVTVEPTEGEVQATVISEDFVGSAAITAECALKPIVKVDFEPKTVDYAYIAVFWKTSRLLLRIFQKMGYNMQKRFNQLLMEEIPTAILAAVRTASTAFTPDPLFKVADPNNFDAIVAVISGLINKGFIPNVIMVNPVSYGLMVTSKATDGHYSLSNGGSIQILGGTLKYGEYYIELVQDPLLAADEFVIGDLTNVYVFLDSDVEYHQGYNDNDDMRRNIVGHVLEQLAAILVPNGAETGIVKDTFANVKTLIEAA